MKNQENTPVIGYYTESYHIIRHNKKLSCFEKILFEEICTLSKLKGYCYAKNKYLAELFQVSVITVKRAKANLRKQQLIYHQNNATWVNWEQVQYLNDKEGGIISDTIGGITGDTQGGIISDTDNNIINKTINNPGENNLINKESINLNNELNNKDYAKYKKTTSPAHDNFNNTGITNDTTISNHILEEYTEANEDYYKYENSVPYKSESNPNEESETAPEGNEEQEKDEREKRVKFYEEQFKKASDKPNNVSDDSYNYGK